MTKKSNIKKCWIVYKVFSHTLELALLTNKNAEKSLKTQTLVIPLRFASEILCEILLKNEVGQVRIPLFEPLFTAFFEYICKTCVLSGLTSIFDSKILPWSMRNEAIAD